MAYNAIVTEQPERQPEQRDNVSEPSASGRRVAVIGGGIAGLAAAHRLTELAPGCRPTLFDPRPRLGGVLETIHEQGFQVERSADNFITTLPWGLDLCRRLGLEDELVTTNAAYRRTFVVHRGRLRPLPDGFLMMAPTRMWPLAVTPLLSPWAKLRAGLEYFIPPRRDESDESMAQFVRRRLGREAFDRLVEPLVSAVYAADMERLSVAATLSRFRDMEREHGSLIRAMRRQMAQRRRAARGRTESAKNESAKNDSAKNDSAKSESGARYSMFVTLRRGLSSLIDALADRLPAGSVHLGREVTQLQRTADGWRVDWREDRPSAGDDVPTSDVFDAVILATPSYVSARLLDSVDAELAGQLNQIEHSGTAILSMGFDCGQIAHPLDGMGAVVPAVEGSPVLAMSFSSQKYPHRAPEGKTIVRVFVGGARRPEMVELPEQQLRDIVHGEVKRVLGVAGEPCYEDLARWPRTMPQYHVGHLDRVAGIETRVAELPGLELAGNAFHGVGLPDCIHGGELAAERALSE